jgi:Transcription factor WhiB
MTGSPPATQPDNRGAAVLAPARVAAWLPNPPVPGLPGNRHSWARVIRQARCTDSNLDADEWFPVSAGAERARQEAAAAIAVCRACPVRVQCLALSLRHWDIGQYGVWGGTVAAERAGLRRAMLEHRADALRHFMSAAGRDAPPN